MSAPVGRILGQQVNRDVATVLGNGRGYQAGDRGIRVSRQKPLSGSGRGGCSSGGRARAPGGRQGGRGTNEEACKDGQSRLACEGPRYCGTLNFCPDQPCLPSLADAVHERANIWTASGNASAFRAAFNKAVKLGVRPGETPRGDDPSRSALLRRVLATLAVAYLPLVPRLPHAADCVVPLWACAKAEYWEDGLAAALVGRLAQNGGELLQRTAGQNHGLMWWTLSRIPSQAQASCPSDSLLKYSSDCLLRLNVSDFNSQACANVLLAAARLQRDSPSVLHHMTACLAAMASSANGQDLANALYALGKLADDCGHTPRREDLQRLAGEVAARQGRAGAAGRAFKPQEVSNMMWGCAKLGLTNSAMLQPLAAAAGQVSGEMQPQELSNSFYALAVLGCFGAEHASASQALAGAAAGLLRVRPEAFAAQGLSNTLWAVAVLQPPGCQALVAAAATECQRRGFAGFKAQELSNATWALAKLGCVNQHVYAAAVKAALEPNCMAFAAAQALANLLYALALVRHRPPAALLTGMADEQQLRTQASAQTCVNSLWALAILYGCIEQEDDADQAAVLRLVHVLAGRLGQLLRQPGQQPQEQELANSLWALAVMGPGALSRHSGLVEGLLREVLRRWEEKGRASWEDEALVQLWQVQLELAHVGGDCAQLSGLLSGAGTLLGAVRGAAVSERREPDVVMSSFQRQVLRTLSRLQQAGSEPAILSIQEEHWVAELCCRVDAVLQLACGRRVAVEVDGPTHFLANHPYTRVRVARTQLRDRQLGRMFGQCNVLSVPGWEWRVLTSEGERQEYLRRLLGLA